MRILVAEDDSAVAKLYTAYAQSRGHGVLLARDGAETLEVAEAELPDLVLLDVSMPRLDGREALQRLKASTRTAGIPVLVISAFGGDRALRELLLGMGAFEVLEKPVDLRSAFDKAERVVAAPRPPS